MALSSSHPPLDLTRLRAITDGDADLERTLFGLFGDTMRRCCAGLAEHVEGAQWQALAHELKGAAANMGAMALTDLCAAAEKTQGKEQRRRMLVQIEEECSNVRAFLQT